MTPDEGGGAGGEGKARERPSRTGPAWGARLLLLVIVTVGTVQVLFMLGVEGVRLVRSQGEISRLEAEVEVLESEAEALRSIIEHGDDERYREALARRQGYMYPSEVRIVTDDPPPVETGF